MSDPSSAAAPNGARRFRRLAIGIVLAMLAYSGGWFWAAGALEEKVRAASAEGPFTCTDIEARGFPFRIGLFCSKAAYAAPGGPTVELAGLRSAAQIYKPGHLVAEADGAAITVAGLPPVAVTWALAQASLRMTDVLPQRASIIIDTPQIKAEDGRPLAAAESASLHMRRAPAEPDALDLAFDLAGVAPQGAPGFAASGDASLKGADALADALRSGMQAQELLRGRTGELRALTLDFVDGGRFTLSGPFSIAADGKLSGSFAVKIEKASAFTRNLSALAVAAGRPAPDLTPIAAMGGAADEIALTITITGGAVSSGFIPLGTLPAL